MVWFHGGLLQYGSGHMDHLRPNGKLSRDSNFVFVSFNYRLQAMGFLALDLLANSGANSSFGNYGLWDSMVVLEWIQRNIHAFGGDPRRVTLFGSDGGSAMIMALMTNPDSRSLFRSVWLIDPALYFNRTFAEASNYNHNNFLSRTDCHNIDCLYKLSAESVLKAFIGDDDPSFIIKDQNDLPIQGMLNKQLIVIDDELVTAPIPFPADTSVDIPVLVGSAVQATEYWPGPKDLWRWTWSDYNKYVTTSLDSFGPRLTQLALQQYPPSPTIAPALQYLTMVTDLRQTCPVNLIAANLSALLVSPVYRYLVTSKPSQPITMFDIKSNNSLHFWDLMAFFGTIDKFIKKPTELDQRFAEQIRDIVFNFVRDGRPDSIIPLPSKWDQSFPHQMAIIDSNDTIVVNNYVISDRCEFWDTQGLTKYAWIS
ncbi:unnamed protein product [Medioppia subpectinata]|uniref:Carboxylesterase type B domain-containing protein n=1 Tax=Medioppia subpectinata TaxID=1979941 RepID=A0A7R9KIP5_9ACAR|nr:unnamed protein product [Medioppia subpectinata]CAG2104079.1 unnamed protein product [Medioppia subpectinata]